MITKTLTGQLAKSIQYIKPVSVGAAAGLTGELYRQMQADFLPGPVLTLHSPAPNVMAGVWSLLRETLLAGNVDRASKEIVAATVSKLNECPFCVDAHTSMLHATADHSAANAILRGDYESIRNPRHYALVQWALGQRTQSTKRAPAPPFPQEEAPELIATAITFHYINRMVNVFLVGDALLPLPSVMQGLARRLMGVTIGKRMIRPLKQGSSLQFVPPAQLPKDLAWAAANPAVAGAFAGFARVVDEATQEGVLSEPVRRLVSEHVQAWNGEAKGISRQWVEEAVVTIDKGDRVAARLALLTALASYQVDASIITDFQAQYPHDAQLIGVTAWASFMAARRAAAWLAAPFASERGEA